VRSKWRKKRRSISRIPPDAAGAPGERWAIDFIHDSLAVGRPFRVLSVIDVCLSLRAGTGGRRASCCLSIPCDEAACGCDDTRACATPTDRSRVRAHPAGVHCTTTPVALSTAAGKVIGAKEVAAGCGATCFIGADSNVYCAGNDSVGATGHAAGASESTCAWAPFNSSLKCTPTFTRVQGLP